MRLPIAKEGFLYGGIPLIGGVIFLLFSFWIIGIIFIFFAIFLLFFFRYPLRVVDEDSGSVYAPCDGKVVDIRVEHEDNFFKGLVNKVSIFMSIFNVHINYAPIDGVVEFVKYTPGRFNRADVIELKEGNENNFIGLSNGSLRVGIRQVAGWIARRIVCDCKIGDRISCGERIGMIKFGSRVDMYFPKDYNVCVKVGQVVRAGRTILGNKI